MMTKRAWLIIRRAGSCMLLAATVFVLTACRSSEAELTATVLHQAVQVELDSLRSTSTVARARIRTTLDYAGTQVSKAEESSEFLRFSLGNLGTDRAFIDENVSQIENFATQPPATRIASGAPSDSTLVPPPTSAPQVIVTPPIPSPAPTAIESGPRLENIVLASAVDQNDCALDVNPRFTSQSAEIYVVAEIYDIPPGATISSSWRRDGNEVALFDFQKQRFIDGSCIWFYIDQSVVAFQAGSWSVELQVDGVALSPPVDFQIVEA